MRVVVLISVFQFFACGIFAQTFTSTQDGLWSNGTTWVGGVAPNDTLTGETINVNHKVTLHEDLYFGVNTTSSINCTTPLN